MWHADAVKVGTLVVHLKRLEWGPGRVLEVQGDKLTIYLRDAPKVDLGNIVKVIDLSRLPDAEADGPLRAIHNEMRGAEERLAHSLSDHEDTVVVADGPLTFEDPVRGAVVGYIKRLFKLYLPENRQHVLSRLTTGTRTPLFGLRATRRFARYAWFIRLAPRQLADSELSGIVRLEVSDSIGVDAAKRLADATAFLLPKFAPPRSRDPRSPQNLLPIGALEAKLRRRLGDARLIRRHIETLIARGVQDAANTA